MGRIAQHLATVSTLDSCATVAPVLNLDESAATSSPLL
jgi:hypothetical protein